MSLKGFAHWAIKLYQLANFTLSNDCFGGDAVVALYYEEKHLISDHHFVFLIVGNQGHTWHWSLIHCEGLHYALFGRMLKYIVNVWQLIKGFHCWSSIFSLTHQLSKQPECWGGCIYYPCMRACLRDVYWFATRHTNNCLVFRSSEVRHSNTVCPKRVGSEPRRELRCFVNTGPDCSNSSLARPVLRVCALHTGDSNQNIEVQHVNKRLKSGTFGSQPDTRPCKTVCVKPEQDIGAKG